MEERFGWPIWDDGLAGVPVLRDALASIQGRIVELKEVGSHSVMFVRPPGFACVTTETD
jgi:flavin reductase (NADH)